MLFQHTHEWIFGTSPHTGAPKTATSRIVKPGDVSIRAIALDAFGHVIAGKTYISAVRNNKRVVYHVGQDYAVQPGRGKKAIGRVRITAIERYDVRTITAAQARAEGFCDPLDFLALWVRMHDNPHGLFEESNGSDVTWAIDETLGCWEQKTRAEIMDKLNQRPAAKYDAWLLTFEPISEVKP